MDTALARQRVAAHGVGTSGEGMGMGNDAGPDPDPLAAAPGIRTARPADLDSILVMIRELADYEKLSHAVLFDRAVMDRHLFGERPYAEVLIAESHDRSGAATTVGFALFFHSFSTFVGMPGIYLEDLFVRPAFRGQGHGQRLFTAVAGLAVQRGCGRLEWSVLDWNEPAIGFYRRMGAVALDDWTMFRLAGDALRACAL